MNVRHMSSNLGQLLLIGIPGPELDAQTRGFLRKIQAGGYIIFTRNIQSPSQLRKLLDDLRDLSEIEPIFTLDQEGGRVSRLKAIGNEPPNAQQLREKGDAQLIRRHGDLTGRLLRLFGFNLDLCPVLDISFDDNADNSLFGRCYGTTAEQVIRNATLFNDAMRCAGVLSCGKHFPGYSSAANDPHHELPVLTRSRGELERHELAVFHHFIPHVDSMMIGHIAFSELDPSGQPASLSPAIVRGLLREKMGFQGLVMTDDLDMGAILNHYGFEQTMRMGIEAGNDLLMICHRTELAGDAIKTFEQMPAPLIDEALGRVAAFKSKFSPPAEFSEAAFAELNAEVWQLRVEVLGEARARERSPESGKRSPVEIY
ncbi:MAG: glycosyl hydrolase [Verrucomicrobia bacterium]|nr:MAG: glycosyl hydrolase [Verrucomicrobiota bacterium]